MSVNITHLFSQFGGPVPGNSQDAPVGSQSTNSQEPELKEVEPTGRALNELHSAVTLDDVPSIKCHDIADIASYPRQNTQEALGKIVCVSDEIICYVVKNGFIRVIDQGTGQHMLIREAEHNTADVATAPGHQRVLASVAANRACIYKINEATSTSASLSSSCLLTISNVLPDDPFCRVRWSPDGNLFAVLSRKAVQLWSLSSSEQIHNITVKQGITDASIAADGRVFVTTSESTLVVYENGVSVHSVDVPYTTAPASHVNVSRFGNGPDELVVVLADNGTSVQLWRVRSASDSELLSSLRLALAKNQRINHVHYDTNGSLLVLSYTGTSDHGFAVVHIRRTDANNAVNHSYSRFDFVTRTPLTLPALSFWVHCPSGGSHHKNDASTPQNVQVYTAHTKPIQMYSFDTDSFLETQPAGQVPMGLPSPAVTATPKPEQPQQPEPAPVSPLPEASRKPAGKPDTADDPTPRARTTEVPISPASGQDAMPADRMTAAKKKGPSLLQQIDALFARRFMNVVKLLEKERAERQKAEAARLNKLLQSISDTINSEIPKQVEGIVQRELHSSLLPALQATIAQATHAQMKVIAARPGAASDDTSGLVSTLRGEMRQSFQNGFREVLLPTFQNAIQSIFSQINTTLEQGLQQHVGQRDDQPLDDLKLVVEQLGDIAQSLRAVGAPAMEEKAPAAAAVPSKAQLQALVAQHQYNTAFSAVLSTGNLDLLVWLCSSVDKDEVFSPSNPSDALQSHVLLSLIQQVAFHLNSDVELKMQWLKEALMAASDAHDEDESEDISAHLPAILEEVFANVEEVWAAVKQQERNTLYQDTKIVLKLLKMLRSGF